MLLAALFLAGCSGSAAAPPLPTASAPPELAPVGWVPIGGPPGPVLALAADGVTRYAATGQGVYRLAGGAGAWELLDGAGDPPGGLRTLAVRPGAAPAVYAGGRPGLWRWTEAAGWTKLPLSRGVLALALGTEQEGQPAPLYAGTGAGLYRSLDGGATWTAAGPVRAPVYALAPADAGALYIATNSALYLLNADGAGAALPWPTGASAPQVYALAATSDGLLAATDRGAFYYAAAGWTQLTSSAALALAPLPGDQWLVGTDNGVTVTRTSLDEGENAGRPAPRNGLPPAPVYALLAEGGQYDAATAGGVYHSADGQTWTSRFSGLPPAPRLGGLAVVRGAERTELYVGTNAGVFRSDDNGAGWRLIAAGLPPGGVYDLALTSGAAPVLFAATSAGVYVTGDGGATWRPSAAQPAAGGDIRRVWSDPSDPNTLYAAPGGAGGVARSWNRGAAWVEAAARLPPAAQASALLLDPAAPARPVLGVRYQRRVGVLADPGAPGAYRLTSASGPQGGEMAWLPLGQGLAPARGDAVTDLARAPGGGLLAATGMGVWLGAAGEDGGFRWTLNNEWPGQPIAAPRHAALAAYPGVGDLVYAGGAGVVARRQGAAANWVTLGRPPQRGGIAALAALPITVTQETGVAVQVLAAVDGRGLWRYEDREANVAGRVAAVPPPSTPPPGAPPRPQLPTDRVQPGDPAYFRYFPVTGHQIGGGFRNYWEQNNGLRYYGYPLTEEFVEYNFADTVTRTVQYFERARLELHMGADGTARIRAGLLGREAIAGQYFVPSRYFVSDATRIYFAETQHSIRGAFYDYWRTNEGITRFGYPLSEEMEADGRTIQWFERARLELRPDGFATGEGITLGQLGRESLIRRGWNP